MEIGTGVAIAGSVWAIAAVIMTVMKKRQCLKYLYEPSDAISTGQKH